MNGRKLIVVVLGVMALALGVSQTSAFAGGSQPSFTVQCVVGSGGQTTITWNHWRITKLNVLWYDPAATLGVANPTFRGTPNGQFSAATPGGASTSTKLHVDFFTDSSLSTVEVPCKIA